MTRHIDPVELLRQIRIDMAAQDVLFEWWGPIDSLLAPVEPAAWGRLYDTASRLMAALGFRGEIDARSDEAALLNDALHALDGGEHCPGLMPGTAP